MSHLVNRSRIAIILSTYNGEKFLPELIDSILNQTCQDYTLYIRDDGSSDQSELISKDYASRYDNVIIIPYDKNYGAHYSFLVMMEMIDSEYYMFCDQDDIWLPNKIEDTFNLMKNSEFSIPNTPIVIHTDLKAVDGDLNPIAESFWAYRNYDVELPHAFLYLCHYNDVTGCTMMINRLAKQSCNGVIKLTFPDYIYYDYMICLMVAKAGGKIIPLKKQTIIYRRHGKNETDALKFGNSIVHHWWMFGSFIKQQKIRFKFYDQIGYGRFEKFLYYKIKLYILKLWRKKHV